MMPGIQNGKINQIERKPRNHFSTGLIIHNRVVHMRRTVWTLSVLLLNLFSKLQNDDIHYRTKTRWNKQ
jgi:hypothetical protein